MKRSDPLTDATACALAVSSKPKESSWPGPAPGSAGSGKCSPDGFTQAPLEAAALWGQGRNVPLQERVFNGLWKMCLWLERCYKESLQELLLSSWSNLFCRYKTMNTKSCWTNLELKIQLQTYHLIDLFKSDLWLERWIGFILLHVLFYNACQF